MTALAQAPRARLVGRPEPGERLCGKCRGNGLLNKRVASYPGWAICGACEGTGVVPEGKGRKRAATQQNYKGQRQGAGPSTEKDNPMVNILACARARESAEAWLAERKIKLPIPPRVSAAWVEVALVDAFAAGWGQATAPGTEAEVNEIVVSLVRDAIEAAGDSAPEEAAAIDAAQRIVAYLGAIHREEQDQWGEERQIGQRQLDDATALMRETAELLRGHERHHRDQADEADRYGPTADGEARRAKAERNALAAARLEAWLRGEERYPTNPAEALRQIAEGMVDGEAIRGVDHASFDAAAAKLDEPGVPDEENPEAPAEWFGAARWRTDGVADLAAFRVTTGDPRFDPAGPVVINGFLYHPAHQGD